MQPRWLPTLRAALGVAVVLSAVLADGSLVTLLGVPPSELERLRRWHTGGV